MLKAIIGFKKLLTKILEIVLILTMTALVLTVVWGVITRIFGHQAQWSEELATFLLVWVAMLGSAVAYSRKAHLGVDYFVSLMNNSSRHAINIIVHLLVAFFAYAVMLKGGGFLTETVLNYSQPSPAMGIERGYIVAVIPATGIFFLIFAAEFVIEEIALLAGKKSASSDPQNSAKEAK